MTLTMTSRRRRLRKRIEQLPAVTNCAHPISIRRDGTIDSPLVCKVCGR